MDIEDDELRAASQRALAAISEFRSLKAEAFSVRKKLEEEAPMHISGMVDTIGVTNVSKDVQHAAISTSSRELLAKREKIKAEREEKLRQLRAERNAEKQSLRFSSPCPSPSHSTRSPSLGNRELSSECSSVVGGTGPEDPVVEETATLAKAAGKGKGRPSGKGRPLPPPTAGKGGRESWPKGKGNGSSGKGSKDRADGERTPGGTRLVNLHWRTSLEPEETKLSATDDSYLTGMVDMLPKQRQAAKRCRENLSFFEKTVGIADAFCLNCSVDDDRTPIRSVSSPLPGEREAVTPTFTPNHLDTTPTAAITPAKNLAGQASPNPTNRKRRRNTIFSGECAVRELPYNILQELFKVKPTAVDMGSRSSMGTVRTLIRDTKHLQIIDIMVKKEAIMSKRADLTRQESEKVAVEELLLALRRCDYKRCPPQTLDGIRKVTAAHMADRNHQNVLQYVESRGEEALQQLDHPHLHRLLYGALQIPAIDARLECMVMEANSEESFKHCYANLMTLGSGLETLVKIIEPLRHFFATMRTTGNMLNQECSNASAAVSGYGVKMNSIVKLLELKSHVRKEVSLFHLVVLMLPPRIVEKLIEKPVIDDLFRAKLARSYTVYQACTQFLEGFRQIRQLVETGKYKDVEIPVDLRHRVHGEEELDRDVFFERMRTFVASRQVQADQISFLCTHVYEKYRAFGAYLDDWKYVYPPPSDEPQPAQGGEERRDLFEFFHWLLTNVKQTKEEIVEFKLDVELELKRTMGTTSASRTRTVASSNLPPAPCAQPIGVSRIDGLASAETDPHSSSKTQSDTNPLSLGNTNLASTVAPNVSSPEDLPRTKAQTVASPVPDAKPSLCTSRSMRVLTTSDSPPPSARVTAVPVTATQASAQTSLCRSPGRSDGLHSPSSSHRVGSGDCNSARDSQHVSCKEDMTTLCPPPRRRIIGPVVKVSTVESPTMGTSSRGLSLPGVHRQGTPRPHSSVTSLQGHESPPTLKSNSGDSGKASDSASPANSPTRTTRKCRKSLTHLANQAERQGIFRVLGESAMPMDSSRSRTSSMSRSRSPCASSDGGTSNDSEHPSVVVGFAAEIREGARMRQGRFFRGQHALELPAMGDDELGDSPRTWRNCRSPDARTPGNNKYALSPVWESNEASHSMTPARRCRHYEHMSPVPIYQLQGCS